MIKEFAASAILFLAVAPFNAHAADAATAAPPTSHLSASAPAAVNPARHHRSTVHDVHGQRFDVPNSLMRNRDTLINGLPPQPAQFD